MTVTLWVIAPLVCLVGGACALYLIARLLPGRNRLLALLTAVAFAAAWGALLLLAAMAAAGAGHLAWGSVGGRGAFLEAEPGGLVVSALASGLGVLVALYSGRYLALDQRYETYYPLLLLLVSGVIGMVMAGDLFNLYLFCELMSVSTYTLVSFRRRTDTAIEAGFKYLIIGGAGTAIVLMGISLVYRESGQLSMHALAASRGDGWTRIGTALIAVGLGIKSAIVPLHTWLPDAHGRAPSSISAMLSGIIVQSAFYALLKTVLSCGLPLRTLGTLLIGASVLNMTLGNALALVQVNTKRLLAYSTIAQVGYVMLGVGIGLRYGIPEAVQAGFFLLVAHAFMKGLAFLCKGVAHFYCDATSIVQLQRTVHRLPLISVAMSLSLAGLAGVPPLAGFAGKWLILTQFLRSPDWIAYVALAVFVLNGLVALGYYLPLIATLFVSRANLTIDPREQVAISAWMALPIVVLGGLVLAIGLYPTPWLQWMAGVGPYLLALGG